MLRTILILAAIVAVGGCGKSTQKATEQMNKEAIDKVYGNLPATRIKKSNDIHRESRQ